MGEDHGETGTDARAGGDEYHRFEERGDTQDTACGYATHVDVGWGALDGAACEVAGAADDEGEAVLAGGVGDRCEAVPRYELVRSAYVL